MKETGGVPGVQRTGNWKKRQVPVSGRVLESTVTVGRVELQDMGRNTK